MHIAGQKKSENSEAILQSSIPYDWKTKQKLPGMLPVKPGGWLHLDEAHRAQIRLKQQLLATKETLVCQLHPEALVAAQELLETVVAELIAFHAVKDTEKGLVFPDGRCVLRQDDRPLHSLSKLVQEDFCILQKIGSEHVLTGALLCFPASWTLSEKFLRPLAEIHAPVPAYNADIARRVQRLFDGVKAGRALWRFNVLNYAAPDLFQPRPEHAPRLRAQGDSYVRSERQTILRLPKTDAVVFSIHTYVVKR